LLIDLAIPSNIDKNLATNPNTIYFNLDTISSALEDTKAQRFAAMDKVKIIINEELSIFQEWLQNASLRTLLADYKIIVNTKVKDYFKAHEELCDDEKINAVANQVMRKLMAETDTLKSTTKIDALILEQVGS